MRRWLNHPIHVSWRITCYAAGVVGGVVLSPRLPVAYAEVLWALVLLCICLATFRWRYRWCCTLWLLAGLALGAWRGTSELRALTVYRTYYGAALQVSGVLRDDASFGRQGDQRFELQSVRLRGGTALAGRVWVSSAQGADIKRGDSVTVSGAISPGFGVIPATMYRARITEVIRPHPGDAARLARDWFAAGVRRSISEPQASLGIGYLTGQRSTLPAELDEQLRVVGLTHAVVASGYNLTVLVSLARNLLAPVSKYLATLSATLMVVCFMAVTGLSPSMTRAGLVSGFSLATWYYGRVMHPVVLLVCSAAVTVLVRPSYAWGDIGWCLSFAAFAGIVLVAPLIRRYFWEEGHDPPLVPGLIVETIAAELVTLPIILYSFSQLAVYALPANLLVLPLVPLTMACTFLAGVVSLAVPGLAGIAGWPASMLLHYMIWVVGHIAELPGAQKQLHFGWPAVLGSYFLLSILCFYLRRKTKLDWRGSAGQKTN